MCITTAISTAQEKLRAQVIKEMDNNQSTEHPKIYDRTIAHTRQTGHIMLEAASRKRWSAIFDTLR